LDLLRDVELRRSNPIDKVALGPYPGSVEYYYLVEILSEIPGREEETLETNRVGIDPRDWLAKRNAQVHRVHSSGKTLKPSIQRQLLFAA
jgi:hypothetical protein